jgi:hypothetical protein
MSLSITELLAQAAPGRTAGAPNAAASADPRTNDERAGVALWLLLILLTEARSDANRLTLCR